MYSGSSLAFLTMKMKRSIARHLTAFSAQIREKVPNIMSNEKQTGSNSH